jgi:V8-like Glu-specific endopeptidase
MYGCKGKYTLNKDNLWNYDIPTYLGMGGSALIVFLENDKLGVIGVHVATSRFKKQRIGARLTTEKLKLINQQMQ